MDDEAGDPPPVRDMAGRRVALVGGLWNAAQMVLPLLGTTALSIVLGRVLGPDLLGEQSLISYSEALLAGVLVMSLQTATLQLMSSSLGSGRGPTASNYAWWGMAGQVMNGILSAAILVGVGLTAAYPWAWVLAGLTGLVNAVGWGYATRVIAHSGTWTAVASRRLWTQMLGQLVAAVAVLLGAGLTAVFAANLISAVILQSLLRRLVLEEAPRERFFPRRLTNLWGLFLARAVLLQVVAQRVEFLFLAAYSTPDQIAMYSIPFMVISAAVLVPSSIIAAGMPAMAAREGAGQGDEVAKHLGYAVRVTVSASIPLALGLAALGPALIVVLYGSQYAEAGRLLAWMAPLVLVLPAAAVCETYWYGVAALRIPLTTATIAAVVDLALSFGLIPRFDALGAAWANLGGQGVGAILLLLATHRHRRTVTVVWSHTVMTFITVAVVAAAAWWVTTAVAGVWGLLAGIAVALIGCLAIGRTLGFFQAPEAQWLAETLPHRFRRILPLMSGRAEINLP